MEEAVMAPPVVPVQTAQPVVAVAVEAAAATAPGREATAALEIS
jgi:hypothetical protein